LIFDFYLWFLELMSLGSLWFLVLAFLDRFLVLVLGFCLWGGEVASQNALKTLLEALQCVFLAWVVVWYGFLIRGPFWAVFEVFLRPVFFGLFFFAFFFFLFAVFACRFDRSQTAKLDRAQAPMCAF